MSRAAVPDDDIGDRFHVAEARAGKADAGTRQERAAAVDGVFKRLCEHRAWVNVLSVHALMAGLLVAGCGVAHAGEPRSSHAREPIIGLPCEGCEAVFEGLPDTLASSSRIAPPGEPGEALRIEGIVFDDNGRPATGVIVYAYHTDAGGVYPRDEDLRGHAAYRHGRLRGWVQTDERGRYRFETIRPASYPNSTIPAHVHMHIIEVGCCTYYIDSVKFDDDPLLSPVERKQLATGRGGSGLVAPRRDANGVWIVRRDIRLGEGVPGYFEHTEQGEYDRRRVSE